MRFLGTAHKKKGPSPLDERLDHDLHPVETGTSPPYGSQSFSGPVECLFRPAGETRDDREFEVCPNPHSFQAVPTGQSQAFEDRPPSLVVPAQRAQESPVSDGAEGNETKGTATQGVQSFPVHRFPLLEETEVTQMSGLIRFGRQRLGSRSKKAVDLAGFPAVVATLIQRPSPPRYVSHGEVGLCEIPKISNAPPQWKRARHGLNRASQKCFLGKSRAE